jgi:SOS response regulatory protein OraA/RecX
LWKRLEARGFPDDAIAEVIADCKRDGYLDDDLFATLYVEGPRKAAGDSRLVAELVKRGIARDAAQRAVAAAPSGQAERLAAAYAKLRRTKPDLSYQSAARALERLGFPASLIYRVLREDAAAAFADVFAAGDGESAG